MDMTRADLILLRGGVHRRSAAPLRADAVSALPGPRVAMHRLAPALCRIGRMDTAGGRPLVGHLGLEDVVAKHRHSPYVGRRSDRWMKVKHAHARDLNPSGGQGWARAV